ncbi:ABC transporter substrate-binding protein [Desulfonatronum sp. SC1]|uniref:ABC transporter substrate-binding protein n=1 Tax=Desulfonatronum sp. SC1 TaxID=2109626 RepID=UPI000D2FD890|nr:ABC transporter substrate-binding protein [Desulfonatronum sp. SC1]PTN34373.1 ABC transporter substrate-binding protein [Desulfonatronum sp. SC1]
MTRYLLALATAFVFGAASPVWAADPIKIGAILSATGPASFLGEPERNTLHMLQDQINEQGGLLGRPLEVIIYDDETEVNKAVSAANRLLSRDRVVAAIGATTSGNTLAIMPRFSSAQIPLVSMAAAERIVKPLNPWVFKTPQSDRHAVIKILEHAKSEAFSNIAILTVSDGFGQAGREVLQELLPAYGMNMVADEIYGPRDTDMTPQLTKIRGLNPDAIIVWGTNPGPAVIARNRVQLGMQTPMYMSHGVASKRFIELAGEAAEGLILPAGRLAVADQLPEDHPQKALLLEYIQAYEARFNAEVSTFGGYAYDAMMLIAEAINRAGEATPQAIRDNLEQISGFIGTGGIFEMSAEDHNGLDERAFVMVRITGGDWELLVE